MRSEQKYAPHITLRVSRLGTSNYKLCKLREFRALNLCSEPTNFSQLRRPSPQQKLRSHVFLYKNCLQDGRFQGRPGTHQRPTGEPQALQGVAQEVQRAVMEPTWAPLGAGHEGARLHDMPQAWSQTYIGIHICTHIFTYRYVHGERDRERERGRHVTVITYACIATCIHTYIYIHLHMKIHMYTNLYIIHVLICVHVCLYACILIYTYLSIYKEQKHTYI